MPQYNIRNPAGSAWSATFAFKNEDGTVENITGKTWEFVARPAVTDTSATPAIRITAVSSSQGILTIDVPTATIQVTMTAAAAALIGPSGWPYALWMDASLSTATCRLDGLFTAAPVAAP